MTSLLKLQSEWYQEQVVLQVQSLLLDHSEENLLYRKCSPIFKN